jgi:heme O synthase-like polyprenyltransferase
MNGLFVAAIILLMNRSVRLPRLSLLAGVAALTGLVLAIRGGPTGAAVAVLFTVVGIVTAAGGALALRRYLRYAPPPEGA